MSTMMEVGSLPVVGEVVSPQVQEERWLEAQARGHLPPHLKEADFDLFPSEDGNSRTYAFICGRFDIFVYFRKNASNHWKFAGTEKRSNAYAA